MQKSRRITVIVVVLCCSLLGGCFDTAIHSIDQHVKGLLPGVDDSAQAIANEKALKSYSSLEYYHGKKRPSVCLALSGGGIRSAAFSIGVMKGLYQLDKKNEGTPFLNTKVDVISAVSGGGYAMAWYYMNYTPKELFDDRRMFELGKKADFLTVPKYALATLGSVAFIPINLFVNGLFGWHLNTNRVERSVYASAIKATFHDNRKASYEELAKLVKDRNLPSFILNMTARIDEDRFHHDGLLSKSVFEVTPWRFGNDAFDYNSKQPFPLDLATANALSGAALDSTQNFTGASQRVVASAANFDSGLFIDNYKQTRPAWKKLVYYASIFPFYFFNRGYYRDAYGESIYLSDGGHSENLGVWSLVRRQCEQIIVVDAEYDPNYTFEAYFTLRDALAKEMHVTFELTNDDKTRSKIHDIPEWIEKRRKEANISDFLEFNPGPSTGYYDPKKPVLQGTISSFPYLNDLGKPDKRDID